MNRTAAPINVASWAAHDAAIRASRLLRLLALEGFGDAPEWVRAMVAATWATTRRELAEHLVSGREPWELALVVAAPAHADAVGLDAWSLTGALGVDACAIAGAVRDRENVADAVDPSRVREVMRAPTQGDGETLRIVAARRDGALWVGDAALRRYGAGRVAA